jgi:hypothetical protein
MHLKNEKKKKIELELGFKIVMVELLLVLNVVWGV